MSGQKGSKLKQVLDSVPPGFLVDARWLAAQDISTSSVHDYQRRGWLEHVARGIYRRPPNISPPGATMDWRVAILSAQWIMGSDFHVGATTALGLAGHEHYLALGKTRTVYLFGNVPTWLARLDLDATVLTRRRQLFGSRPTGIDNVEANLFAGNPTSPWRWPLKMSSPERAIFESLNELPDQESFHTLDMLFEGLGNLRPRRLTALLSECRSIKVKRLFFLFADRHRHSWLNHIDREAVDLGSGPRQLVEGGQLNSAYQLVVPAEFAHERTMRTPNGA